MNRFIKRGVTHLSLILFLIFIPFSVNAVRLEVGSTSLNTLEFFSEFQTGRRINGSCYRNPNGKYGIALTRRSSISTGDRVQYLPSVNKWIRSRIRRGGSRARLAKSVRKMWRTCKQLRKNPKIGINLFSFNYFSSEYIFADVTKQSSAWLQSDVDADDSSVSDILPISEETGWPTVDIPWSPPNGGADQKLSTLIFTTLGGFYPSGDYTLILTGTGFRLRVYGATDFREFAEAGTYTLTVDNSENLGIGFELTEYDADAESPLRMKLLLPGITEAEEAAQPFNPQYLRDWSGTQLLRHMLAMETIEGRFECSNGVEATDATCTKESSDRPTRVHRTQVQTKGIALSYLIDLCEALHTSACWFNVQHGATDEFIRDMAEELRDTLDPSIKIYLEYSNEMFNSEFTEGRYQYPQHIWARNKGLADGLDTEEVAAGRKQMALASANAFSIFEEVFGSSRSKRVEYVLGGWLAINSYTRDVLTYFNDERYNPNGITADALAVAAYVGFSTLNHFSTFNLVDSCTPQDILTHIENSIDNSFVDPFDPDVMEESVRSGVQVGKSLADEFGLELITYEAGQHLVPQPPMDEDDMDTMREKAILANQDSGIGDIYQMLTDMWNEESSNGLLTFFSTTHITQAQFDGDPFGMTEYTGQPRSEAPKYDLYLRLLENAGLRESGS